MVLKTHFRLCDQEICPTIELTCSLGTVMCNFCIQNNDVSMVISLKEF